MANKKCPKCGKELSLRDGYGVCNGCGEIVVGTEGEELTAVVEEIAEEVVAEVAEEESDLFATQIPEEIPVEETVEYEEIQETAEEELAEEDNRLEETFYYVPEEKKPRSAVPALIVILCAMLTVGAYYVVKDISSGDVDVNEVESFNEEVPPIIISESDEDEGETIKEEVPVFEEPVAKPVESLEPLEEGEEEPVEEPADEPEKEPEQVVKPDEKPQDTPNKQPAQKPAEKPVKKPATSVQKPVEKPATPAIAYRVRKSANDSKSQIGAFADLERAKNFARGNASDGYKVFDMNGNLVFAP